jgi:hypothetical protein
LPAHRQVQPDFLAGVLGNDLRSPQRFNVSRNELRRCGFEIMAVDSQVLAKPLDLLPNRSG